MCTAPGSTDHFVEMPDFVAMPINNFEISKFYECMPWMCPNLCALIRAGDAGHVMTPFSIYVL